MFNAKYYLDVMHHIVREIIGQYFSYAVQRIYVDKMYETSKTNPLSSCSVDLSNNDILI